jgi:hypothetical protein
MQARIMRAVFKLGLYAQRVRVALRRVRLDVHGVCAYVEVVLIALHYCTTLRRYRGMRSVANKAAAQAAAAPAGMRCVRRECGGLRPRRCQRGRGRARLRFSLERRRTVLHGRQQVDHGVCQARYAGRLGHTIHHAALSRHCSAHACPSILLPPAALHTRSDEQGVSEVK